ncbi:signal peptidase I [Pyxidicoccus parkwayensis]|uniref:Signal peptidase I n=1 Tax=Pyxidicoccus parkwayensis TaxID=2813578 RepID=A0ABX7NTZ5_9BACT|nr:signal peptidase I [Pyxidicoccus parkwaysis]QSQ20995.1 signal peptidase I [Pyxidicoccus parkwaysis]
MSEAPSPAIPEPLRVSRRRRVFAVLLSLLPMPGAGHWLLGLWGRGLFFLGVMLLCFALVPFVGVAALVLLLVVYLAAAVDAGRVRPPAGGVPSRGIAALCVLCFVVIGSQVARGIRTLVAEPWHVPSAAMEPTLLPGDQFFTDKTVSAPVRRRPVERGEVIVFTSVDDPNKDYVKRVVAVGGDTVALRDRQLFLDGQPVARARLPDCAGLELSRPQDGCELYAETLGAHHYQVLYSPQVPQAPFPDAEHGCPDGTEADGDGCRVANGYLFVLGDNRDNSSDSRYWGAVPESHLKGVATSVHFSLSPTWNARWARVGQRVP